MTKEELKHSVEMDHMLWSLISDIQDDLDSEVTAPKCPKSTVRETCNRPKKAALQARTSRRVKQGEITVFCLDDPVC